MTAFILYLYVMGLTYTLLGTWPSFRFIRFKVGAEGGRAGVQTGYKEGVDLVFILPPYKFQMYKAAPSNWILPNHDSDPYMAWRKRSAMDKTGART